MKLLRCQCIFIVLILISFIIGVILLLCSGQDLKIIIGNVLASVGVSLSVVVLDILLKEYKRKKAFYYLIHNDYKVYGYKGDLNTSTVLNSIPEKETCVISAGKDCDLEIRVAANNGIDDWAWIGFITMTSLHTGEVAYYHENDSKLTNHGINSTGYKKITSFKYKNEVRVYISQVDRNMNFGREVYVAKLD